MKRWGTSEDTTGAAQDSFAGIIKSKNENKTGQSAISS